MSLLNVTPAQEEKKASALENAAKVLGVLGSLTQQGMGIAQTMGGLPMFSGGAGGAAQAADAAGGAGGAAQAADAAGGVADALQAGGQLANPPQTIQGGWDWRPRVSPNQNMIG